MKIGNVQIGPGRPPLPVAELSANHRGDAGEAFIEENIRIARPGGGAEPRLYPELLSAKATRYYRKGDPLTLLKDQKL